MKRHVSYFYAVMVLTVSLMLFGNAFCVYAAENNTITKGVFIDEVDVSGLTAIEAENKIIDFVNELREGIRVSLYCEVKILEAFSHI